MPVPTNYAGPRANEKKEKPTYSQTPATNQSHSEATVEHILNHKGHDIFSVQPDASLGSAVDELRNRRIGAVLVLDETGELAGILSERDIVRKLSDSSEDTLSQSVETLMTSNVQTASPQETLNSILKRMTEGRFRHMPEVKSGSLHGMITIGDVVNHRRRELEYETVKLKQIIVG